MSNDPSLHMGVEEVSRRKLSLGGFERMWNPTAPLPTIPNGVHFSSTVCLVGAHGGAGTSSWAQVLGFEDCGRTWPVPQDGYPSVFVVARLDMNGLKAAKAMGIEWAQGVPCRLAGLLLVPDAPGKPPRDLFRAREIAGGAFPASICLPWVETWRVNPGTLNRTAQRGINEVKQLLEGQI